MRSPRSAPRRWIAAFGLLLGACLASPGHASEPPAALIRDAITAPGLDAASAVRASQAVIGRTPGEHTLLDGNGRPVRLASFLGKPLLVSFIYTGCFEICPANTRSLREAVRALEGRFGTNQFNVISIGFNQPDDSPQAMQAFAAQHGVKAPHWSFLSPAAADVDALTRAFGFSYAATPAGFDHVLQLTLVDSQGRIVRQVYGGEVMADVLGEPLKSMLKHGPLPPETTLVDHLIDRVRILCTVYDATTDSYRVDYSLAIEVAGGLTFLVVMLVYFGVEWRSSRRQRRPGRS